MKKKILWITRTAVMLALLIVLQWLTRPLGQIVTGSCVNAVLAVTVLVAGCGSGLTIALISPVAAYLLGIAPQIVTVPAIMLGNTVFVLILWWVAGKRESFVCKIVAWVAASVVKFAVMYALVVWVICGAASDILTVQGILKQPMVAQLSVMFAWPQLCTALIGSAFGLLIAPVLKKALGKN